MKSKLDKCPPNCLCYKFRCICKPKGGLEFSCPHTTPLQILERAV